MNTNQGILKAWNFDRGYGFIYERTQLPSGKVLLKSYFAHITEILSGEPVVNCIARFNVAPGKTGKAEQAINIEFESIGGEK